MNIITSIISASAMLVIMHAGMAASADNPHPSKKWSAAEENILQEALREWTPAGVKFREVKDCTVSVDFTVRWEDSDFFKKWDDNHDWSSDLGRYLTASEIPGSWSDEQKKDFPVNEIYFRSDVAARFGGIGWFVDTTPAEDSEFDKQGNLLVATVGAANGKFDLLSLAKHEVGHVLGVDHPEEGSEKGPGVMFPGLDDSYRRHPIQSELNAVPTDFKHEFTYKFIPVAVPEPSSFLLLGSAFAGLALKSWRRRK